MGKLRGYFDVGFALLLQRYKWLLAATVVTGIAVGVLFAAGVFGGDGKSAGVLEPQASVAEATPTPIPPATTAPTPEPTFTPPTPRPTVALLTGVGLDSDDDERSELPVQKQVKVPINLQGASDLGSLEFVLVYEAATLEFVSVDHGALGLGAIIESNLRAPGKVWVGMIDPQGVNGDGSIAVVSFRTVEGGQVDSPLLLEDVLSHNASTLLDTLYTSSPGIFTLGDGSFISPVLEFE